MNCWSEPAMAATTQLLPPPSSSDTTLDARHCRRSVGAPPTNDPSLSPSYLSPPSSSFTFAVVTTDSRESPRDLENGGVENGLEFVLKKKSLHGGVENEAQSRTLFEEAMEVEARRLIHRQTSH